MAGIKIFISVAAYLAIGVCIARWMGGDRSHLSPDVTYLDWLGFLLITLFWPILPALSLLAFLRNVVGR